MHAIYNFDFLDTISRQLYERLETLPTTALTSATLADLAAFQVDRNAKQGVYMLYVDGRPVYIGKADDVRDRLFQHLTKLSGRANITMNGVAYKCLLLDKSMSTAANETILMGLFMQHHEGMWNNSGFGPKDPGKERDTTKPSKFDQAHPINVDFPVNDVTQAETISSLFAKMKQSLPFVFRYENLPEHIATVTVDLGGTPHTALALLTKAMSAFEPGWRAAVLYYGMVIYKTAKAYPHALQVIDAPTA